MDEGVAAPQCPWEEFDLSALTYPQFLAFFFDRPVVGDDESYDLFRSGIDEFTASTPAIVVDHLHRMCRDLADLTKVHSAEQIDQGLWAVFGAAISCERYLFDSSVDQKARTECIESMYLPFRDIVAKSSLGKMDSFYWMWWDMILHTFPGGPSGLPDPVPTNITQLMEGVRARYEAARAYESLSVDAKQVLEAIHETLLKILALDHPACQWSALHGLGHSPHPKARDAVNDYLRIHRGELSEEDAEWVECCAKGKIM
jgi:hypothetical protein